MSIFTADLESFMAYIDILKGSIKILLACFMTVFLLHTVSVRAAESTWFSACPEFDTFRFESGFEESIDMVVNNITQFAYLNAKNLTPCCQDGKQLRDKLRFGSANIQFQGGSPQDRGAEIVVDPVNKKNKVLAFWLAKPNVLDSKGVPEKGRVQMNVAGNKNIQHVKMSVRLFLHPDFEDLSKYPERISWLAISEWWNNADWTGEKFPFRIGVRLYKDAGEAPLYFYALAETYNVAKKAYDKLPVWTSLNRKLPVPIGKWMTLDYEFIEGDVGQGRFFLAVTPDGEERVVVFDVHNYTHHPDDKNPDGLAEFNPLKLYTNASIINFLGARGKMLQMYWDDLQLIGASH